LTAEEFANMYLQAIPSDLPPADMLPGL